METALYLSFVTASISFTVTETKLFAPLREWARGKETLVGRLLSCGYCLGHWVAFALVAIYQPRLFQRHWLLDYFLTALAIAWIGAFEWAAMSWLMQKTGK
jgi:hypothetical protein